MLLGRARALQAVEASHRRGLFITCCCRNTGSALVYIGHDRYVVLMGTWRAIGSSWNLRRSRRAMGMRFLRGEALW